MPTPRDLRAHRRLHNERQEGRVGQHRRVPGAQRMGGLRGLPQPRGRLRRSPHLRRDGRPRHGGRRHRPDRERAVRPHQGARRPSSPSLLPRSGTIATRSRGWRWSMSRATCASSRRASSLWADGEEARRQACHPPRRVVPKRVRPDNAGVIGVIYPYHLVVDAGGGRHAGVHRRGRSASGDRYDVPEADLGAMVAS
jgi:hypothetical protein